jgi:DHA2 family multidrug resistance protein-like MFS transporter
MNAPPSRSPLAIVAVMLGALLVTLDISFMYTAVPAISRALHETPATSVWVVNAYHLALVAAVVPLAALGEAIGHRRVHVAGALVYTASLLLCGLADSLASLVAARALQGLGAAAVVSVTAALVRFVYPLQSLGRGLGLYAFIVSFSLAIGPTLASAILTFLSWNWLFFLAVPLGASTFVLGRRFLPVTAPGGHGFDPVCALLSAAFFTLFTFGLGQAAQGVSWIQVALLWAASALCCLLLLRRQAGHPAPMLAVDLFRLPVFALSSLTSILSFVTQGLAFVALPFLFQNVMGWSQMAAGLLMSPWPVVLTILSVPVGRLSDRWPPGVLGGIGLGSLAVGMGLLAVMPKDAAVWDIGWRMVLCAAGFSLFQTPNINALMSSAPAERSGGASGIVATSRMLGQAIGVALAGASFRASPEQGPIIALWLASGSALAASAASLLRMSFARR